MKKKTLYPLGILLSILIGTWLYMHYCCNDSETENSQVVETNEETSQHSFTSNEFRVENAPFEISNPDNFNFLLSHFDPISPISDSLMLTLDQLGSALTPVENKLKITGYALASEENSSMFPNLGLARANVVKQFLVEKGIEEHHIIVLGETKEDINKKGDTLIGPLRFQFEKVYDTPTTNWTNVKDELNKNPLVMQFNTGKSQLNLTESDREKALSLSKYLSSVVGGSLMITGHSDNVGDREKNTELALERAEFIKNYFVSNGIPADKIQTSSKGPDEPIADNDSAEGRAKNRRTTITIN